MRRWFLAYLALFAALLASWGSFAQLTATGIGGGGFGGGGGGTVTFDAAGLTANGVGLTFDYTGLTVGTANGLLAYVWNNNQENFSSVVWDQGGTNQSLTFIGRVISNSGSGQMEIWGLIGTVTAGNKTLRATIGISDRIYVGAISLNGVNQGSIAAAFPNFNSNKTVGGGNTDTSIAVSITSASGHIVTAGSYNNLNSNTITMNNTQIDSGGFNIPIAYARAAGAGSVSMTETASSASNMAIAGVDASP